jgi:transposase-like protein
MAIDKELLDKLLADYKGPEDLIGEQGLLNQLTKALIERAMQAELTHHLGYEKHDPAGRGSGNARNGTSRKTIQGNFGSAEIEVPRDRNGSFQPQIVPTATSLAITCTAIMVSASAWVGFTLPGMIDEPGSLAGITNSAKPARGPQDISRMSLAIL